MSQSTFALIQELKNTNQDFEWYPSTTEQIKTVTDDIKKINKNFSFTSLYNDDINLLDIGAGDGRVLNQIKAALIDNDNDDTNLTIELFAIEKSTIHIANYRKQEITLLGTEFNEINFISKKCDIAFVNPPYSEFSYWLQNLLTHLQFKILYAVLPTRWENDLAIKEAMLSRGVKFSEVLSVSDFLTADRKARAKVNVVRFTFDDVTPNNIKSTQSRYKPTLGANNTDPFQLFLENELGLKKTHSETTEKFNEYLEKERIKNELQNKGSHGFSLVQSKGVLLALLDNYETTLANTLHQYKLINAIDPDLLQELGVNYDHLKNGAKAKLLGYRHVYWNLLFDNLEAISTRLTSKHKKNLLNDLSLTALDFTYTNAIYVIGYAVEIGNELIEQSLIDVYVKLTNPQSISRYYKSNEHLYSDTWRYNQNQSNSKAKYLLDYRFIYSSHSNFHTNSWSKGLNEGARDFCDDLLVVFKLLGYSNLQNNCYYDHLSFGGKISITGTKPTGDEVELVVIKFYKNGNRHLKFNQDAMLRFNVTVSRLLGWVRSKEDFSTESDVTLVDDTVWELSNKMKVTPKSMLALTCNINVI